MPTCERSPDGEHHYFFDDITFDEGARRDWYVCAYCSNKRDILREAKKEIDITKLPTDSDLDKK